MCLRQEVDNSNIVPSNAILMEWNLMELFNWLLNTVIYDEEENIAL